MTLTESIRSAVIDMRHDGEAIRPFAARLGVPHMTLYRFLCGASVDSDTLDRLAALGSPSTGDAEAEYERLVGALRAIPKHYAPEDSGGEEAWIEWADIHVLIGDDE
jgi:hypothetical protein